MTYSQLSRYKASYESTRDVETSETTMFVCQSPVNRFTTRSRFLDIALFLGKVLHETSRTLVNTVFYQNGTPCVDLR
jgi:hypothetical protein